MAETNVVILGIGSNIDAEENISKTLKILNKKFDVLKTSSFVKTEPVGIKNQPEFTNGAVKIKTRLKQEELKKELKNMEDLLGRDRSVPKFGPRTIDIDIVVWNGEIIDKDYYSRDFLRNSVLEVT